MDRAVSRGGEGKKQEEEDEENRFPTRIPKYRTY
jgi:hypothetical protein